jgi:hypothetical protein
MGGGGVRACLPAYSDLAMMGTNRPGGCDIHLDLEYLILNGLQPVLDYRAAVRSLLPLAEMENCMFGQRRTT